MAAPHPPPPPLSRHHFSRSVLPGGHPRSADDQRFEVKAAGGGVAGGDVAGRVGRREHGIIVVAGLRHAEPLGLS